MPRFTKKTKGKDVITNYEGEKAYRLDPKMELYSLVCTASLQKSSTLKPMDVLGD